MNLQHLLRNVDVISTVGDCHREISSVTHDHRLVEQGCVFTCYEGVTVDGHEFISPAVQNGAEAIVGERPPPRNLPKKATYIQTTNGRAALSLIAANWYGNPADHLKLIGITGTNGKTSTAYLTHAIFEAAGLKSAVMGTVGHRYGDEVVPAPTTTPDSLTLHGLFAQFVATGLQYVIMETSSQGLAQYRLAGLMFETAVFTNLTQDHLDYHETMDQYLDAKAMLFRQIRRDDGLAILNADDSASKKMRQETGAAIQTYGLDNCADLTARDVESTLKGLAFTAVTPRGDIQVKLRLNGDYNLYNALAAIGVAQHHECSINEIKEGLENTIVPGRFELVDRGQDFAVVVDYAHTPDGLENLLTAARRITQRRLICVFGCGGDRDRGKRPKMGRISAIIADHSVITSDNPRTENRDRIIDDILTGVPNGTSHDCIPDRKEAIVHAIRLAKAGDLVAIAGKGHEDYQILGDRTIYFDDREVAAECLEHYG
ncbi:MAG: UDP-N-acetylmuramoyl-L-alanyl-D-glutamate--2,6-diaminopimelate ligase [Candidatus Poribacteria bacterium]|nr:UDP-N-acetylmuramoyl-L-alanyl-D-glutamate--2,6-diaminopimelate ligase [Candidatus Poribacteria bacterium]MDE0505239.1 UDP-N-acetylmuramoyl-L-alanyl-D-glutamate--2,6-diaminopimelate ligase [Candidatus Poribacteria bacterium]